jgi:hypothetical protein
MKIYCSPARIAFSAENYDLRRLGVVVEVVEIANRPADERMTFVVT